MSLILKEREFKLVIYKNIEKHLENFEFRAEHETTRTEIEVAIALIETRVSMNKYDADILLLNSRES